MSGTRAAGRGWAGRGVSAAVVFGLLAGAGTAARAAAGGHLAVAGLISTVAGGVGGPALGTKVGLEPCGVAFGSGSLYAGAALTVRKVNPGTGWLTTPAGTGSIAPVGDGGAADKAGMNGGCGVAVDRSGNLLIADTGNQRVRVVAARTGTFYGRPMTAGHIYTVAGGGTSGLGDGGPATSAKLGAPEGVAVDGAGNVLIADAGNQRVRVVAASTGTFYGQPMTAGDIYTVAGNGSSGFSGDGGPATSAEFDNPFGVAADGAGNALIADAGNGRVRVAAASTGTFYGRPMTAGDIYAVAGNGHLGFSGDGGPATSADLNGPVGVAADGAGNLLIADGSNNRIRVVAASTGTFYGQPMTAGDIYAVAGNGSSGFSGDGGPATSAEFDNPFGVAADGAGNALIADAGNGRVRVAAASTGTFYGRPMTAGDIYAVAGNGHLGFSGDGGPATSADLNGPVGVAADGAGNLLIADGSNNRIRVVAASTGTFYGQPMTAGDIYTVAGNGQLGFSGDGGPATHAEFWNPYGVAADGAGNLLIADTGNERIRVMAG